MYEVPVFINTYLHLLTRTFISERTTICACTPLKSATASLSGRIIFSSSSSHKCLGGGGREGVAKSGTERQWQWEDQGASTYILTRPRPRQLARAAVAPPATRHGNLRCRCHASTVVFYNRVKTDTGQRRGSVLNSSQLFTHPPYSREEK